MVTITVIRYSKKYVPFALMAMGLHRLPLLFKKDIKFYKLMGCGRNGSFDKNIDWQQWAIFTIHTSTINCDSKDIINNLYGKFIGKWVDTFHCETFTIILHPLEGHGVWDGKKIFGDLPNDFPHNGPVAILTRASIRLNRVKEFWQNVPAISSRVKEAKGLIFSVGMGELPLIKQATFSIWNSIDDMKAFAYGLKEHTDVIGKTRAREWYSEELFVRFRIIKTFGTMRGINPMDGKTYIAK